MSVTRIPREADTLWMEERLRAAEFGNIEFRSAHAGRQAYMKGSRLSVWWVVMTARQFDLDIEQTAAHFEQSVAWVQSALNYYAAYPTEIDQAMAAHEEFDFTALQQMLPNAVLFPNASEDGT